MSPNKKNSRKERTKKINKEGIVKTEIQRGRERALKRKEIKKERGRGTLKRRERFGIFFISRHVGPSIIHLSNYCWLSFTQNKTSPL